MRGRSCSFVGEFERSKYNDTFELGEGNSTWKIRGLRKTFERKK